VSTNARSKPKLYEQLCSLPEGLRGEIINGQLRAQPRPSGPHSLAMSRLGADIEAPFGRGRGGPGGWWILDEPEIHFVLDREVLVPDIAGWRRERMPRLPEGHRFEVVPDWICEILSPSTKSTDREEKMPLYACYGVQYAWLVDTKTRTLEAYRLDAGDWLPIGIHRDDDEVRLAPFEAVTIRLSDLWA
jgi:Uma2 family endonuclease